MRYRRLRHIRFELSSTPPKKLIRSNQRPQFFRTFSYCRFASPQPQSRFVAIPDNPEEQSKREPEKSGILPLEIGQFSDFCLSTDLVIKGMVQIDLNSHQVFG